MADLWDIARYVEAHPENHEQRWRLAKKLYMAWEYRLALEHLQVLKNEWRDRINVARYLAATYYRLGRYDEAIQELRDAVETWPEEMAWDEILALDSGHSLAAGAAKRLRAIPEESPEEALHLTDSDSGIDLSPKRICSECGAQNGAEMGRRRLDVCL